MLGITRTRYPTSSSSKPYKMNKIQHQSKTYCRTFKSTQHLNLWLQMAGKNEKPLYYQANKHTKSLSVFFKH
jgi:hypothetical protein